MWALEGRQGATAAVEVQIFSATNIERRSSSVKAFDEVYLVER
jgi:hypothetical protein